jgi:medium-chain acyl-[acyl-carrier-protein] hydrolase
MKYCENHLIEYSECDENSRLKLTAMVDLMMMTSEHQLEQGGAGTQALLAQGLGWVVTQYIFEIKRLPKALEQVVFTTEATGYNRFFEYRDFGIETPDGKDLVTVHSQWVVLDLAARKLVGPDQQMMLKFKVPLLKKMPRFPRLRPDQHYQHCQKVKPSFYDLDTNHHVTNSHYFNWLISMFDRDFLRRHQPQKIDLRFDQEVKLGTDLQVYLEQVSPLSSHLLLASEQKEHAICLIDWRQG